MSSKLLSGMAALSIGVAAGIAPIALAGPAVAAPSGTSDAQTTIGTLQAEGFRVLVSRVGDAPIDKCTVNAVRPGRKAVQSIPVRIGARPQQTIAPTVYVDLICKR
ncbi:MULTISPECIES: hypothetical protein [Mycobacteriaceae]|uniref:hypothetical protein n=1 Tax=Mycobacteriaceae TaxID=1762 RepID=UPI001CD98AD3|nr:hypothetical protein [Mycobacterium sp. WUMAC-067]MCA2243419.1 hypothetical protein [Mycobacterium sp. WUMAC-067]